jgi:hypothetical protein
MVTASRPVNAARHLAITEEVQARLSLICAAMPTPLFNEMVARIALVQLTFEADRIPQVHIREEGMPFRPTH